MVLLRYEVRVVALSTAGQAAVERAVYTLTAGKNSSLVIKDSLALRYPENPLTRWRRCFLAKPLTALTECKSR